MNIKILESFIKKINRNYNYNKKYIIKLVTKQQNFVLNSLNIKFGFYRCYYSFGKFNWMVHVIKCNHCINMFNLSKFYYSSDPCSKFCKEENYVIGNWKSAYCPHNEL